MTARKKATRKKNPGCYYKYWLIDAYTGETRTYESRSDEDLEMHIDEFIQEMLERCEICEVCELDITIVGPVKNDMAQVREIYINEIPPREPAYEYEWR
jgi:hypothetical protein